MSYYFIIFFVMLLIVFVYIGYKSSAAINANNNYFLTGKSLVLLNKYSVIEEMDINREFSHVRSL